MTPVQTHLPLPNSDHEHFVHVVHDLLSPAECQKLIASHTSNLIRHSGTYTKRLREIYDDTELAEVLWERLKPFYGDMKVVDTEGQSWTASHLNTTFRFCKYLPGDLFGPHYDGQHFPSIDLQSFMTVNMYLNDVSLSSGGATRIIDRSEPLDSEKRVLASIQPAQGIAAIFREVVYHDGEPLNDGLKYLLRTDMIFKRDVPMDFEAMYGDLGNEGKGWKALEFATRLEDAGSRDAAVVWYQKAYRLCPKLEREA